jgi:MFS family permease
VIPHAGWWGSARQAGTRVLRHGGAPVTERARDAGSGRGARAFLGGQAVSLLGDGLAVLAIPLLVLGLSRNPLISALSAASVTVGYLAVGLPAGVLIDRLDAWRVLVATDVVRALLFGILYLLSVTGAMTVWLILLIALAAGASTVFFETALVVVVKDLFSGPGLLRANSWLEFANQAALMAGPATVGVLAASGNIQAALLADSLTFVVSLASLTTVRSRVERPRTGTAARRPTEPSTDARPPNGGRDRCPLSQQPVNRRWRGLTGDFREGLRYLLSVRVLVTLTAVQIVVNLCLAVEKLIFYYARDTLGLGPQGVSVVVAMAGAGGIAGALTATRLAARTGQIRLIAAAIAAAGVAIGAMSTATSVATLTAANFAYSWALTVASLVNRTQRQQIVPRALLGRVTATVRLLFLTVDPLGVVAAGLATQSLGGNPRPVFLGAGVIVVATAVTGWLAGLRRHAGKPE